MQKTTKCAEGQDNESTDSFQNYSSRRLLMFVYKAGTSIKKRDFLFNIMCGKFRFDGDVWRCWKPGRQHRALPVLVAVTKKFFSFLGRMVLFLSFFFGPNFFFIFFFTKDFLPLLIFPWARASTCEFCKVHAVKKNMEITWKRSPIISVCRQIKGKSMFTASEGWK